MAAIETTGLTKRFESLIAVDHLDLAVDREIFGLLGPNGSGKTTTVKMLTTLLIPTEGDATICGYSVTKDPLAVREQISYVPQDMAVDPKLTGRENVIFFAKVYGVPRPREVADEALAMLDLAPRADDLVRTYSGGMRRRLELAQALVHPTFRGKTSDHPHFPLQPGRYYGRRRTAPESSRSRFWLSIPDHAACAPWHATGKSIISKLS